MWLPVLGVVLIAVGWVGRMCWEYAERPDWEWSRERDALQELGREWR